VGKRLITRLSVAAALALLLAVPTQPAAAQTWPLPLLPVLFGGTLEPVATPAGPSRTVLAWRFNPNPCVLPREANAEEDVLRRTQRRLYETACRANLWFDGRFGGGLGNIEAARGVYGTLELLAVHSQAEGFDEKVRLKVRWDFPNLENRLNAFLGREDEDDFVKDKSDRFAMRSQFFGLESDERWLAGLGYSLPGTDRQRIDFKVGARLSSESEIFLQSRLRRNHYFGDDTALRFRQVVFYENRDGFGATTSLDFDQVLNDKVLVRLGARGTFSEATEGVDWRGLVVIYQNLQGDRAMAWEAFATGETRYEVPVDEYGLRAIYRQRFFVDGVHLETILGYSWPRELLTDRRKGSVTVGLGLDIGFGRRDVKAD
jgi:hypothetical protein